MILSPGTAIPPAEKSGTLHLEKDIRKPYLVFQTPVSKKNNII
jgi:hypothetical protein